MPPQRTYLPWPLDDGASAMSFPGVSATTCSATWGESDWRTTASPLRGMRRLAGVARPVARDGGSDREMELLRLEEAPSGPVSSDAEARGLFSFVMSSTWILETAGA